MVVLLTWTPSGLTAMKLLLPVSIMFTALHLPLPIPHVNVRLFGSHFGVGLTLFCSIHGVSQWALKFSRTGGSNILEWSWRMRKGRSGKKTDTSSWIF